MIFPRLQASSWSTAVLFCGFLLGGCAPPPSGSSPALQQQLSQLVTQQQQQADQLAKLQQQLTQLQQQGVIRLFGRRLDLLDAPALQKLAGPAARAIL